ncbi:hypothetical protein RJ640_007110, partial [Escallonia rubra]
MVAPYLLRVALVAIAKYFQWHFRNTLVAGELTVEVSLKVLKQLELCNAEDEREFDYAQGSEKGPGRWGELKKEWTACKNGEMQSPIDMSNQRVEIIRNSRKLEKDYKPCNATVKNRGHDIM